MRPDAGSMMPGLPITPPRSRCRGTPAARKQTRLSCARSARRLRRHRRRPSARYSPRRSALQIGKRDVQLGAAKVDAQHEGRHRGVSRRSRHCARRCPEFARPRAPSLRARVRASLPRWSASTDPCRERFRRATPSGLAAGARSPGAPIAAARRVKRGRLWHTSSGLYWSSTQNQYDKHHAVKRLQRQRY